MFSTVDLPNALMDAVDEDNIQELEKILKEGADPNQPDQYAYHPLHRAKSQEAIHLLLEYGANPNLRSFVWIDGRFINMHKTTDFLNGDVKWEDNEAFLSPFESVCCNFESNRFTQFGLVLAFVNFSPCTMHYDVISNAMNFIMMNMIYDTSSACWNTILNKQILERLAFKLPKIILSEFVERKKSLISQLTSISHSNNVEGRQSFSKDVFQIDELNHLIFIGSVLMQKDKQQTNIFAGIPFDILRLIMSYMLTLQDKKIRDCIYVKLPDQAIMKINLFKMVYMIFSEIDNLWPHDFLASLANLKPIDIYIKIQDKIESNRSGMATVAWRLANIHHENFSSANTKLINELVNWCVKKELGLCSLIPNFFQQGRKNRACK